MKNMVIIGGSDAGISAALRAKELNPEITPTMIVADSFPNFSICGLPYYISREVTHWENLAHRTKQDIENEGINLLLEHTAQSNCDEEPDGCGLSKPRSGGMISDRRV